MPSSDLSFDSYCLVAAVMSFKARKFRKKVETEVRDNDESDEDVSELASEKREQSTTLLKSKDSKSISINRGNQLLILSERLITSVTFVLSDRRSIMMSIQSECNEFRRL